MEEPLADRVIGKIGHAAELYHLLIMLMEDGIIEAQGIGRGRSYMLSVKVYKKAGQKAVYVRQAGFDPVQQEQMLLTYIDKHGSVQWADVMELCRLSGPQAYHLLKRLQKQGKIRINGEKRHAFYTREM